jgi:hypothetical protein
LETATKLIASDVADLTSSKLKAFLNIESSSSMDSPDISLEVTQSKQGNAAKVLKGAGSSISVAQMDFSFSDADL